MEEEKAILLLQDGSLYLGKPFGHRGIAVGELCFNTGMTGYQEVFTDPSYYGQVLIMNNVHIGNYGIKNDEVESNSIKINGLIGKNLGNEFSRNLADNSLEEYLRENKLVGIHKIDTRSLVEKIRSKGAMNCIISSTDFELNKLISQLETAPTMKGLELSSKVTTSEEYELGDSNSSIKIAVLDLGIKRNILKCLTNRKARLKVFPATTNFSRLKEYNPSGYFISNGPGDPAAMGYAIDTAKEMMKENKAIFGICLGYQILALANNVNTFKMHHGHRGLNHPVKNLHNGYCEITTQNHGFGVDPDSVKANDQLMMTHLNLNDRSVEGFRVKEKPFFSVQYHPEATPGPHHSRYLFDEFISLCKN